MLAPQFSNDDSHLLGLGGGEHSRPTTSMCPVRPNDTPTWEFCGTAGKQETCFLLVLLRGQDSTWSCWQLSCHLEVEILRKELTQRKREWRKLS